MSQFGAKVVGFLVVGSISGLGYLKYSQYSGYNQKVQEMIDYNQLEKYLFNANQQSSYMIDTLLDNHQRPMNQSNINRYKETLLKAAQGKVLQTCAGSNRTLKYYPPGTDLTLIDWSPKMVATGLTKNSPVIRSNYVVGDVRKMPFADNQFDTVVDIFGLEYVIHPQKALQQMRRVCKKNGTILLMNQGLSSIVQFHYFENFMYGQKLFNMGIFTNRNWQKIIKQFDFKIQYSQRKKNGKIYIYILKNMKDNKVNKDIKDNKVNKDIKDNKVNKDIKDIKGNKDIKDNNNKKQNPQQKI